MNAATYVGTLAHAELTGMKAEKPGGVLWDATTPAAFHAGAQANGDCQGRPAVLTMRPVGVC